MDEAMPAGAMGHALTPTGALALCWAASAVSALLDAGLKMDEVTPAVAIQVTADAVDRARMDATAVSAHLDTGNGMDEATAATAFRASRWMRRRRPAPWDAL